ncbi:MAG: helix-turn-helix domain-containing protein [Oscillospiraceae bacterium]
MFEKRLRALREEQGFQSQQALANALGVAQSTVANWECGRREPNYETTKRLAELFQVTVDYLMGRGDDPHGGAVSDHALKAALLGGDAGLSEAELDELWEDVREYARYKVQQYQRKKQ